MAAVAIPNAGLRTLGPLPGASDQPIVNAAAGSTIELCPRVSDRKQGPNVITTVATMV